MDEALDEQENMETTSGHATPFNVDLFGSKPKNYFTEYTMKVLALPESVKNILMDSSTADFIEDNLGSSFNLNPEQKTEITRIIRDILTGDSALNSMPGLISSKLNIDQSSAVQIANKIVGGLFSPAIEDIEKIQKEKHQQLQYVPRPTLPRQPAIPNRSDLKIEPDVNRNNVVDLRNKP